MRSVRTSYAFSFQDMWKWNSARSSTSRKAGYVPGSKIIEKLIFNQFFEYLIDSNLLADWQNGLRPVHSTLWPPCLEATSSENVKKAIGLISKQQLCTYSTLFCTFLCRHRTTTAWKSLMSRFMEDVNKRQWICHSLPKLEGGPQEINSREIRLHLTFLGN